MPTRKQTIADAIRILQNAEYPKGLTLETAWLGIYQTLLWYEPVNWLEFKYLPHIIDADKLRPATLSKKQSWTKPNIWQRRSKALGGYLTKNLQCSVEIGSEKTDLLMKQPLYKGMQRQNTLGIAFVGLAKYIFEKFGSPIISYFMEVDASEIFPGITVPGRSGSSRIDILSNANDLPKSVISAKWSLRHDRLNDITNECPVYKAAYQRIYRQLPQDRLLYFVLTNEYDPSRLNKILSDTCVDGVIHVHKKAVLEICELDGRLERLMDLTDFVKCTFSW